MSSIALAAAALTCSAPVIAADYSLLFQGVTFEFTQTGARTLNLTMLNTDAATPDWAGITHLNAFGIKDIGKDFTGATSTGGFTFVGGELNAGGCDGNGKDKKLCFTGLAAVAPSLSFDITVEGADLDIASAGPHLKVRFSKGTDDKYGSLMSLNIPAVPEPETYALMLAGLAGIGFMARRRKSA